MNAGNVMGETRLDMVTELVQGTIALLAVGAVIAIGVIQTLQRAPYTVPDVLGTIAGAAVAFYFAQAGNRQTRKSIALTQQQMQDLVTQVHAPGLASPATLSIQPEIPQPPAG